MNEEVAGRARLVLQVLEDFPVIHVMYIAVLVCAPEELYPRIAELMLSRGVFSRGHLHANELRPAAALGPRDQRIVEAVARTACHPYAIETEYPEKTPDIRSFALTTLAGFGGAAAPWAEMALQASSAEDALAGR
ncbi:MAG TPA: hypothetical protein VJ597_04475 [Sphingomicrobium sp.]|nr:hypothetical protein [Sphingomicrobium sp.]